MDPFTYHEHTADIRFRASGKSFSEALANAMLAVANLMVPVKGVKNATEKSVSLSASGKERIVYDAIEEIIYLFETEKFVLASVASITAEDGRLSARLLGDTLRDGNYTAQLGVKAMTYHKLSVKEKEGLWTIEGVVDI